MIYVLFCRNVVFQLKVSKKHIDTWVPASEFRFSWFGIGLGPHDYNAHPRLRTTASEELILPGSLPWAGSLGSDTHSRASLPTADGVWAVHRLASALECGPLSNSGLGQAHSY